MRTTRRVATGLAVSLGWLIGQGTAPAVAVARDDAPLKFSADIAPILAGNCVGCHNPERKRGGLDLTTYKALKAGSEESGPVVVPSKPDESPMVEMVVTRMMPKGNRKLGDEAIAKIKRWVEEGAALDEGIAPTAKVQEIAPSPDDRRRAEAGKLSPEERDKALVAKAAERWKLAGLKDEPAMTPGKHFLIFGEITPERATATLKALESSRTTLGNLLGDEGGQSLAGPQKLSVYLFPDANSYVELTRALSRREPETGETAHANLSIEAPYVAAVDKQAKVAAPAAEEPATEAPKGRTRRGRRPSTRGGSETRLLPGVLVEQLGVAAVESAGKPPRWLSRGVGAFLASGVEPQASYYMGLRVKVLEQAQLGWEAKATEALGDQAEPEVLTAFGFGLCEWLQSSYPEAAPVFLRALFNGGDRLDEAITLFGEDVGREEFLAAWGDWVADHYGGLAGGGR